jgi:hypothetical protein
MAQGVRWQHYKYMKSSWILSLDPVPVREAEGRASDWGPPLGVISGGPPLLSQCFDSKNMVAKNVAK